MSTDLDGMFHKHLLPVGHSKNSKFFRSQNWHIHGIPRDNQLGQFCFIIVKLIGGGQTCASLLVSIILFRRAYHFPVL